MGQFLVVQSNTDDHPARRLSDDLRALASESGCRVEDLTPGVWIGTSGAHLPQVAKWGRWTLVGDVIRRATPTNSPNPAGAAEDRRLVTDLWGRFVGLRFAGDRLSDVFRDPSGALECLIWSQDDLTFVSSDAPDWLVRRLRPNWSIDAALLAAALRDPLISSGPLLLKGPTAVAPGTLHSLGSANPPLSLWRPLDFARRSLNSTETSSSAARRVRSAVSEATVGLASLSSPVAAEVSGGLDSSIVASCLVEGKVDVGLWLNAYGATPEADERRYVAFLAKALHINPTSVPHATGRLSEAALESISQGVRPGLAALDLHHDLDWARRISLAGCRAILTGKGGDSIFVQATEDVFADLWRKRGWLALFHPDAAQLARTTQRSVWSLASHALRQTRGDGGPPLRDEGLLRPDAELQPTHPWLEGTEIFGPAKRMQIVGVANVVARHGPSRLTETIDVRHPLCAQPVVEACLSIPCEVMTTGGRDRGLVRLAFRELLPDEIFSRRSKGNMTRIYARLIHENLDVLRPWLLDGRLVSLGVIDRHAAERRLTKEGLIWHGRYSAIIVAAAFEGWVRVWEHRLGMT